MKKADLPWILSLLQAFNEGKTLQTWDYVDKCWVDWSKPNIVPNFDKEGGVADYRIRPELKEPGYVAAGTSGFYPDFPGPWRDGRCDKTRWNNVAIAVIKAFKAGELELPEELK